MTGPTLIAEFEEILTLAENDNHSAWYLQPDGSYAKRRPRDGEAPRPSHQGFIKIAR